MPRNVQYMTDKIISDTDNHHNPGTRGPGIKASKVSTTPLYTQTSQDLKTLIIPRSKIVKLGNEQLLVLVISGQLFTLKLVYCVLSIVA